MLQIKDICKKYVTGELVQTALDGVSLNLRDNEFVAILGPSGSGKTTLLNVIGGLDRYDSGDLVINGISTKKYTDRDWDSYRNHTIGFVFQSYNLIPHQSVLANVELALTISGISPGERRKRAAKALEDVGLGNQLHKRPNQMSGGQMQRVAIARALVNDPDILLADEPTGALDSETSVQVMELLKEVSKDRLVVMVTHNPELAEDYANRIVRVKDGKILGDTNPYEVDEENLAVPEHKNMGKSSMSFITALALSFNNLWTKKARTLLTAFAGSIGIIGIALIMSLSTGFQRYIDKIQSDTLSNYPLTIQSETADMTAAMASFGAMASSEEEAEPGTVAEQPMITQMFAQIGSNDLGSFKAHLEENYDSIGHTINDIKFGYGVKPRIYAADTQEDITQVNPATLMGKLTGNSMMSAYLDSDIFQEMIGNIELLESQYDVLRGRWPESYDELIVVLQEPNQISDYMAYTLGLKDMDELDEMIAQVMSGQEVTDTGETMQWTYDDLMALEFRLVAVPDMYRYNAEYCVWEDMSEDEAYMKKLVDGGEVLKIVGIVCPKDGVSTTALSTGIAYTSDLTHHVIDVSSQSEIVQSQLADETVDVFTGTGFDEDSDSALSFQNMISVDGDAISSAFGMNVSSDSVLAMLQSYLNDVLHTLEVDTAPAQNEFMNTLTAFSTEMLQQFVVGNADEHGKARLLLTDADLIVDNYLASESALAQMEAMGAAYSLPADTFAQVYRPLMIGMLTNYVASEIGEKEPEVPETTLPTEVPDGTEAPATEPEQENTEPAETTVPTQPEETTAPTEVTQPEETMVPTEATQPEETAAPTEATQPGETVAPAETTQPEETAAPTEMVQPDMAEDPAVLNITEPTISADVLRPDLDIQLDTNDFYAEITAEDVDSIVSDYLSSSMVTGTSAVMSAKMMEATVRSTIIRQVATFGDRLSAYIGSSLTVDQNKIASAFQFNMNEEELRRLMEAMSSQNKEASATANLQSLGYADLAEPTSMAIYLTDFAAKEEFLDFLDSYNADMEAAEKEDQVIRYTDVTGIMMSSVRTIIDSVSYALIAFVAVSLVVSSIMIGIITYISVMERTKEIGVLRAIGASKRNISQVFNAETFIIGLCSGLIGIGVTLLLLIPGNQLIHSLTNNPDITAQLPVVNALVLIVLSVLLTLIGGFIPAKQAAKKDPVIALRSE